MLILLNFAIAQDDVITEVPRRQEQALSCCRQIRSQLCCASRLHRSNHLLYAYFPRQERMSLTFSPWLRSSRAEVKLDGSR